MTTTLPERSIGSIPERQDPFEGGERQAEQPAAARDPLAFFAAVAASHTGEPVDHALSRLQEALASAKRPSDAQLPAAPARNATSEARRDALSALQARVQGKFAGKLELGGTVLRRQTGEDPLPPPAPAVPAHADTDHRAGRRAPTAASSHPSRRESNETCDAEGRLTRNQRRVLVKFTGRELRRAEGRFVAKDEPARAGVWSTQDYRRIRAAVQDTTGRAAICVLYQLGSREAATLAAELDPRIPMDRRKIALAYAVARAPGSELGDRLKLGFALGLWSAVLADPNNPNMERKRRFRPSRRTLSSDLTWLEERDVLRRWQVQMEHAAACEKKRNPNYPTNRYFAPIRRDGSSMMAICMALGDVPPAVRADADAQWSQEDAEALEEVRAVLLRELGVTPLAAAPPPLS